MTSLWNNSLPLIGVAAGAIATVVGQYLPTRDSKARAKEAHVAAVRAELKEAILEFLKICQQVEHVAERRSRDDRYVEGSSDLTHEMAFRQRALQLVAGRDLAKAARKYQEGLNFACYNAALPGNGDVWEYMSSLRIPFLDAAKKALGLPESG